MHNHAPNDYKCPICIAMDGIENEDTWIKQDDIFYKDDLVTGFISSKSIKGNEGHPLVVPNDHYENIYDLPEKISHRIMDVGKKISVGLKEVRNCDGVNFVQNNEPAAGQHAFHYHLHLIPRFEDDNYNEVFWKSEKSDPKDRVRYAKELREYLDRQA